MGILLPLVLAALFVLSTIGCCVTFYRKARGDVKKGDTRVTRAWFLFLNPALFIAFFTSVLWPLNVPLLSGEYALGACMLWLVSMPVQMLHWAPLEWFCGWKPLYVYARRAAR